MIGFWRALAALVFVLMSLSSVSAAAQRSQHFLGYKSLTAARVNPQGLVEVLTLDYQYGLYDSDNPVFSNNFLGLYVQPILSPAQYRLGVGVAIQPLSVLRIDVRYQYMAFFGNFDFLQSFADAEGADWSDSNLDDLGDAETNYSSDGTQFHIGILLQAKVKNFAIRNKLRINQYDLNLRDGDTVWYDPFLDALMPGDGWAINDDFDALYIAHPKFIVGLRYTLTAAYYEDEPKDDTNNPIQRLGFLLSYTLSSHPGKILDTTSIFTLVQWHITHPYRTGADVNQAIPYFAIGMTVTGSLL